LEVFGFPLPPLVEATAAPFELIFTQKSEKCFFSSLGEKYSCGMGLVTGLCSYRKRRRGLIGGYGFARIDDVAGVF
jgi:hypothetical protein